MFSKGPAGMLSGGGEDFTCSSVRKKGRSLSQTSFLFTSNFIHIPQSFELIDQKKTLALAPSFKWHRRSNENSSERKSVNYESSQDNFYLASSAPSESNQNLLFITENESQPSQVSLLPNESRTDLSSSYKYNPIFPENQLYVDDLKGKTSCPASYTSIKHHILENIPISLLSNLNIFLNENKYESLISSKSSFSRTNDVPSRNNHTSPTLSRSDVGLKASLSKRKLKSLKCFLNRSQTQNGSNHFSNTLTNLTDCEYKDLIVLKPASDSVLASCSSVSIISDLHLERRPSSEATLESESVHHVDRDMRVHYINGSGSDVSEYSLLISKGYTFANKLRSKRDLNHLTDQVGDSFFATSGGASNNIAETELCVVNFSEYDVDPLNAGTHRNGGSLTNRNKNLDCSPSRAHFEPEIFQSCNSGIKSSTASNNHKDHSAQRGSVNGKQYVDSSNERARSFQNESEPLRLKTEVQKWEKPPLIKNDSTPESGGTIPIFATENILRSQRNSSLRNTVKKISDRFMRLDENSLTSNDESSSGTYTETGFKRKIKYGEDNKDLESEKSYSDWSDEAHYNGHRFETDVESTEYSCSEHHQYAICPKLKPKIFQKEKYKFKTTDLSSNHSCISQIKSNPVNKCTQNTINQTKIDTQRRKMNKQKNLPVLSRSKSILRQHFSRYTVTSDSTYSNSNKARGFLQTGKINRFIVKERRRNIGEEKMFVNKILRQPNTCKKRIFQSKKLEAQQHKNQNNELCSSFEAEKTRRLWKKENSKVNDCKKFSKVSDRKNINSTNSKQEILDFIGRKIINLDERKKFRNWEHQTTSSYPNKEDSSYVNGDKVFVFKKQGNGAEPEMDVYSRKKKRETEFKNKEEFVEKISNENKVKSDHDLNQKKEASYNEIKPLGKVKVETSRTEDIFGQDTLSANERKDSFYSCRKEESLVFCRKGSAFKNCVKNSDLPNNSRKTGQSNYSSSSELASSYYPLAEKESTVNSSESDALISESTSEYINWAKNCLFNWKNELCDYDQFQVVNDEVDPVCEESSSRAGDKVNPTEKAHVTVQKNVSVIGDRCIEITSISVPQAEAKISNESISIAESKSVLSVILEERDGSELKSPFLSQKSSPVTNISKHNSSNSMLLQKHSVSSKFSCYTHDSSMNKKESLQSTRSAKSRKSQKLQMVCSESEGEYSKFRDEMKYYRKSIPSQNPPRIIPSSSTFTPDNKSVTQIE